jgi:hypothetical protein
MNEQIVLEWLLNFVDESMNDVIEEGDEDYSDPECSLEEGLYELNNRKEIELPAQIPTNHEKLVEVLRKHFSDNVNLISYTLRHYHPDKYVFYRVSVLDREIFDGFSFLSEIAPELKFEFSHVGRNGFDRYLELNKNLWEFAAIYWPEIKRPHEQISRFLYRGLAPLFSTPSDERRYWVGMAVDPKDKAGLDVEEETVWSGRKDMRPDDLVFVYRTAPDSAITDIYRVQEEPQFDPWGAWDGFWVKLERVCQIPPIKFSTMRSDPILGEWSVVRGSFQGVVSEPIPYSIYNQLLELIPARLRQEHNLTPEQVAPIRTSGKYASEADFEKQVVEELLKRWRFRYQTQYPCHFHFGSQKHRGRIDFYVSDERGPLTLFENKLRILGEQELTPAREQGRSYALMHGLPSFVVAAPEGMWVYALDRHKTRLAGEFKGNEVLDRHEEIKNLILSLRP